MVNKNKDSQKTSTGRDTGKRPGSDTKRDLGREQSKVRNVSQTRPAPGKPGHGK